MSPYPRCITDKAPDDSTRATTELLTPKEPEHESVPVLAPQAERSEEGMSGVTENTKYPCQNERTSETPAKNTACQRDIDLRTMPTSALF